MGFEWLGVAEDWGRELWRVALLRDYNTRVVVAGTSVLGAAAGIIGSFALLRRRALIGDALSHAMLPGIALTFLLVTAAGGDGKSLPWLLLGAAVTGVLGTFVILLIRHGTRLREDAAIGIVLSVFFGAGVALLGVVQSGSQGHAAGLESFIYGKTASLLASDAWLILWGGAACVALAAALFKEFKLLCFDEGFAGSDGWPIGLLDAGLMGLIVVVAIIGLQSVGLILMIALLVIPAAAARFWTDRMWELTCLAGGLGAISSLLGAMASAVFPRLPSGATIVLVAGMVFLFSLIGGTRRGLVWRLWRQWDLRRRVERQHLLRAMFELTEAPLNSDFDRPPPAVTFQQLLAMRSWRSGAVHRELRSAERAGLIVRLAADQIRLTATGQQLAARLVHQHRLWELYLITHAEIAPSQVDRDADRIEHVLTPEMILRLERLLGESQRAGSVPDSPHPITASTSSPRKESSQ